MSEFTQSTLGKPTIYREEYDASLLYPILRETQRSTLTPPLPLKGTDYWVGYELSWLAPSGVPQVAIASFEIPASTPYLIESKSFKLYLNSFNQTKFQTWKEVERVLSADLEEALKGKAKVSLFSVTQDFLPSAPTHTGILLDTLPIETTTYSYTPSFLKTEDGVIEERLHSHLLKSNCLVTGQPDWGSLYIHYKGKKIDHAGLLKYIISFRSHQEFHEHCIERIYTDLMHLCRPEFLSIFGKYTRRGGLEINPFRSSTHSEAVNFRTKRQ